MGRAARRGSCPSQGRPWGAWFLLQENGLSRLSCLSLGRQKAERDPGKDIGHSVQKVTCPYYAVCRVDLALSWGAASHLEKV